MSVKLSIREVCALAVGGAAPTTEGVDHGADGRDRGENEGTVYCLTPDFMMRPCMTIIIATGPSSAG